MNEPSTRNNFMDKHIELLASSYYRLTGKQLVAVSGGNFSFAAAIFNADFVVVSHGIESDPIFNYGNKAALKLFEFSWSNFTALPSRLSAKPLDRDERQILLARVTKYGFIDDYRGLRISSSGKTFWIEDATVWNLIDANGAIHGQAAMFKP